jgi:hypothetical protein
MAVNVTNKCYVLGHVTMQSGICLLMFQQDLLPAFQGATLKQESNQKLYEFLPDYIPSHFTKQHSSI